MGNYLGAIKNWATMLDDYNCFFGVVDQHAITVKYMADLPQHALLCGSVHRPWFGPRTRQSLYTVPCGRTHEQPELSCITPIGELKHDPI